MPNKAILVLEAPWWDLDAFGNQASVLPYFEGLSRLDQDIKTYYMTFVNASSFKRSLTHLLTAPQDRLFLYVASHGWGARLGNVNFTNICNIFQKALPLKRGRRLEGVIFGSCEIGVNDIGLLTRKTGVVWVFAYKYVIDWLPLALADCHLMHRMAQLDENNLNQRDAILDSAALAFNLFNPKAKNAWTRNAYNGDHDPDITLSDTIKFCVKPRGPGNVLEDNSQRLIEKAWREP